MEDRPYKLKAAVGETKGFPPAKNSSFRCSCLCFCLKLREPLSPKRDWAVDDSLRPRKDTQKRVLISLQLEIVGGVNQTLEQRVGHPRAFRR